MAGNFRGTENNWKSAQYIIKELKEAGIQAEYEEYEVRCYRYTKQTVKTVTVGFVAWLDAPCGIKPRYDEIHEDHYDYGKLPGAIICHEDGLMLDELIRDVGGSLELTIESDGKPI